MLDQSPTFGDPRLPARFWTKVYILPNGCWEWTAAQTRGYGRFGTGSRTDGSQTMALAHRIAYETLIGPIPDGLESDHLCRNRACVNPIHIEPVTSSENNRRSPLVGGGKGEANGRHKLKEDAVRAIRDLRGKVSQRALAARFGISHTEIKDIQLCRKWRHIA